METNAGDRIVEKPKIVTARIDIEGLPPGPSCDTVQSAIDHLTYLLEVIMLGGEEQDPIRITFAEITQEEYDALPEWQGY